MAEFKIQPIVFIYNLALERTFCDGQKSTFQKCVPTFQAASGQQNELAHSDGRTEHLLGLVGGNALKKWFNRENVLLTSSLLNLW